MRSRFLIAAIHGGAIERWTSEIASSVARNSHGFYSFESINLSEAFHNLHISSHLFDEPRFNKLALLHDYVLTIHGCVNDWGDKVLIGGLNQDFKQRLHASFEESGISSLVDGHPFRAFTMDNVCNRGGKGPGVQLEISRSLRDDPEKRAQISKVIRDTLAMELGEVK